MIKVLLAGLMMFGATSAFAAAKKFEYQTVDYTVKEEFTKALTEMGNQGWELTSCVTSGASQYSAFAPGGSISGLLYARTSYCIFKREL